MFSKLKKLVNDLLNKIKEKFCKCEEILIELKTIEIAKDLQTILFSMIKFASNCVVLYAAIFYINAILDIICKLSGIFILLY